MSSPAKTEVTTPTQGPWQASGVRTRLDGQPMLQVIGPKGVVAYVPYSDLTPKDHLESHADAKLIAAAPDLVKALQFYADRGRYDGPNQRLIGNDPFTPKDQGYLQDVTRDGGDIARTALSNSTVAREESKVG